MLLASDEIASQMPLLRFPGATTKFSTITDVNFFFRPDANHTIEYVSITTGIVVGLLLVVGVLKCMCVYMRPPKDRRLSVPSGLYFDILTIASI